MLGEANMSVIPVPGPWQKGGCTEKMRARLSYGRRRIAQLSMVCVVHEIMNQSLFGSTDGESSEKRPENQEILFKVLVTHFGNNKTFLMRNFYFGTFP